MSLYPKHHTCPPAPVGSIKVISILTSKDMVTSPEMALLLSPLLWSHFACQTQHVLVVLRPCYLICRLQTMSPSSLLAPSVVSSPLVVSLDRGKGVLGSATPAY